MEVLEQEAKNYLQKSKESKGSAKDMYKNKCLMALKKKKQLEAQVKKYTQQQNVLQGAVFAKQSVQAHKDMVNVC